MIARSCAALGLALLVPVLVTSRRESVPAILGTLAAGLPDSPTADESQAVQFHSGLALGMFLAWLHDERVRYVHVETVTETCYVQKMELFTRHYQLFLIAV